MASTPLTTQRPTDEMVSDMQPLQLPDGHVPGKYAAVDVSPEPMYGPDELGELKDIIQDLSETVTKSDSAPRIFEVLQAWEARLFDHNYQFNTGSKSGWNMFGSSAGAMGVMAAHNKSKLFSANIYGARKDKIQAALSREIPTILFSPSDPTSPIDQVTADEAQNYVEIWKQETDLKKLIERAAGYFYTEDRVLLWTASWADEQRWGTETPEQGDYFGAGEPEGVTPETEIEGVGNSVSGEPDAEPMGVAGDANEQPAVAEITQVYGKLEHKVPLVADCEGEMGWVRISKEINQNIAKEKYPWIETTIKAGSGLTTGNDQFDRLARMNVRLAVQNSTVTGESWMSDVTESHTWFRPSQYRQVEKGPKRDKLYQYFPKGMRVTHCGTELAFARNESLNDCIKILHAREGDGQNRRSLGANLLPLQKVLNGDISLLNRYFQACVPRKFAADGPINIEAINTQGSDPSLITPVDLAGLPPGTTIDMLTGVEKVPQPTTGLFEFVQWLVTGAPEAMDGASPAMFGMEDSETYGQAKLNRDAALQVFGTPWAEICWGFAGAASQAVACAAQNRISDIRSKVPGEGRITVQLSKIKGRAQAYPESVDIPESLADQEARLTEMVGGAGPAGQEFLSSVVKEPLNLPAFKRIARFDGLVMTGADAVEQQQGEFEVLMKSGPADNPQYLQLVQAQQQVQVMQQQMQSDPMAAQDPEVQQQVQQATQQIQQQLQSTPPKVPTVPVAQDGSENHSIHASVTLSWMNSEEGRKFKNGTQQQKDVWLNFRLHWEAHVKMQQQLTPVPPVPVKMNASVAIDKLPPDVAAQALQAAGLEATPQQFHDQDLLVPHETIVEKEGVDANGVPIKTRTAMMNPNSGK